MMRVNTRITIVLSVCLCLWISNKGQAQGVKVLRKSSFDLHAKAFCPITFFSVPSVPSLNGSIGVDWSLNNQLSLSSDLALGSLRSFSEGTSPKQGDYINRYQQINTRLSYNLFKPGKGKYYNRHMLFLGVGATYLKGDILYYKTDDHTRRIVDFVFWLSSMSLEYRCLINSRIGVSATANFYYGQSAWLDGDPKNYDYDHFMTYGVGCFINVVRSSKKSRKK